MSNLTNFKELHKKFIEALNYINKNYDRLQKDPKKYKTIKRNFIEKYEKPMDLAWEALSIEDQKTLAKLYLHRKIQTDPEVQKVIEMYKGEAIDFTPINEND